MRKTPVDTSILEALLVLTLACFAFCRAADASDSPRTTDLAPKYAEGKHQHSVTQCSVTDFAWRSEQPLVGPRTFILLADAKTSDAGEKPIAELKIVSNGSVTLSPKPDAIDLRTLKLAEAEKMWGKARFVRAIGRADEDFGSATPSIVHTFSFPSNESESLQNCRILLDTFFDDSGLAKFRVLVPNQGKTPWVAVTTEERAKTPSSPSHQSVHSSNGELEPH